MYVCLYYYVCLYLHIYICAWRTTEAQEVSVCAGQRGGGGGAADEVCGSGAEGALEALPVSCIRNPPPADASPHHSFSWLGGMRQPCGSAGLSCAW
jgi:hypothetical protein